MSGSPARQHSALPVNLVTWLGALAGVLAGVLGIAGCTFSPRVAPGKISCAGSDQCPTEVPLCRANACYPADWDGGLVDVPVAPDIEPAGDTMVVVPDAVMMPDVPADVGADEPSMVDSPMVDSPTDVAFDWPNCVPPAAPNLASGVVFYLHLDETGSNPIIADASPNHLGVAVSNLGSGAMTRSGRFGAALALAGGTTGGWITLGGMPSPPALNAIIDQVSLSVWVKFPPGPPPDGVLLSRQAAGPHGYLYRFSVAGGRLRAQLHTVNGNHADLTGNRPLDESGRWIHLAVTYGDTGQGVELFVDGESHGADRAFGLQLGAENTPVLVAAAEDPLAAVPSTTIIDRFAGAIDEVAVFKRTLTPNEVKALACGAMPVAPPATAPAATMSARAP